VAETLGFTRGERPRILLVEDEAPLLTLLRYNLEKAGFVVAEAVDGQEAVQAVIANAPDLVLLDWMLPVMSGLEVCRQIRRRHETRHLPVIMLTARTDSQDTVRALDHGADDYVEKPFVMEALLARIRALLRRTGSTAAKGVLRFHDLVLDQDAHRVSRAGRSIHLGPTEYRLLEFLIRQPRRVFTREQVLDGVWGRDIHVEPRTVDVHVRRLRKAINGPGEPDLVRTVRAAGYALDFENDMHAPQVPAEARHADQVPRQGDNGDAHG
jgi:two-component system phosphate regulon response regulator PhoB